MRVALRRHDERFHEVGLASGVAAYDHMRAIDEAHLDLAVAPEAGQGQVSDGHLAGSYPGQRRLRRRQEGVRTGMMTWT